MAAIEFNKENLRKLHLLDERDNILLSKEDIELTLYHEIVHSILGTGNYREYSNDEPLVEWIANCLISLKKQKILSEDSSLLLKRYYNIA